MLPSESDDVTFLATPFRYTVTDSLATKPMPLSISTTCGAPACGVPGMGSTCGTTVYVVLATLVPLPEAASATVCGPGMATGTCVASFQLVAPLRLPSFVPVSTPSQYTS